MQQNFGAQKKKKMERERKSARRLIFNIYKKIMDKNVWGETKDTRERKSYLKNIYINENRRGICLKMKGVLKHERKR